MSVPWRPEESVGHLKAVGVVTVTTEHGCRKPNLNS